MSTPLVLIKTPYLRNFLKVTSHPDNIVLRSLIQRQTREDKRDLDKILRSLPRYPRFFPHVAFIPVYFTVSTLIISLIEALINWDSEPMIWIGRASILGLTCWQCYEDYKEYKKELKKEILLKDVVKGCDETLDTILKRYMISSTIPFEKGTKETWKIWLEAVKVNMDIAKEKLEKELDDDQEEKN